MKSQDVLWLSYNELTGKKVRTALTILMVMIGVASIVALVSQTAGISASIQKSLSSLGPTSIILTSTKATGFTLTDIADLQSLPNVSSVTPILEGSGTLKTANENASVTIVGIDPQGLQQILGGNVSLYQGTVYQQGVSPASLVGHTLAFPTSTGGKQNIEIGSPISLTVGAGKGAPTYTVPVGGILNSYGTLIVPVDTSVLMSLSSAEDILHKTSFNTILIKAKNTSSVASLSAEITDIYGNNARVLNTQELAQTASQIIGSISLLLVVIAGISLLVAAIGIMNIMLMSVIERTHEIGIMKSLGFRSRDVMIIFLSQALIIGFLGGVVGIIVGGGASYGLSYLITSHSSSTTTPSTTSSTSGFSGSGGATFRSGSGSFAGGSSSAAVATSSTSPTSSSFSYTPELSITTIAEALFVAMLVSVLAGTYPAWRASKLEPIEALRQL